MKYLIITFFLFFSLKSFSQQDSALAFHQKAFKCYSDNDYTGCFYWSEKLFDTHIKEFRNNYNLYRASVSACQINKPDKAMAYFKEMSDQFLDFYNYPTFAADSAKIKCITNTEVWKNAMAYMKPKYDSMQKRVTDYDMAIKDTSERLNKSILSDSVGLASLASSLSFEQLYAKLKNYNGYSKAPKTNHWTLYQIKINDTLTVPYLVYIPSNYKPDRKTPLYVFMQGAVSNRRAFSIEAPLFELDDVYLKKPIEQNAFIIYPLARRDINWLYHPLAFKAISEEIAFVKSLYNIDDNKVYATGHSDGGRGVFYFAINQSTDFASFLALNFFPQLLITNTPLRNLNNDKPLYGVSGTKDNIFPFGKVDSIYQYGKSIGNRWYNFAFEEGHNLPTSNPALIHFLYDTISKKVRDPFIKNIEWETDNLDNGRYQWIEITKLDTTLNQQDWVSTYNPTVVGQDNKTPFNFNKNKTGIIVVSVKDNEVTVKTSRVTEFAFYIYPELFDISKPIKCNVNNKTVFKVTPRPNKEDLINEFAKTKDRTMLPIEKVILGFDN